MAPDKIYTDNRGGYAELPVFSQADANVEYLLKNALLEWAKEKKKQLLENESTNKEPSDVAAGINAGLDMLIGKLNSM